MNVPELLDKLQAYLPSVVHRQVRRLVYSEKARILAYLPIVLILAILSVYIYWNYVVLPALFQDSSPGFWFYFCYVGGAWVFHGICGHYYLMSFRNSYVPNHYMVPFTIDDKEEQEPTESERDRDGGVEENIESRPNCDMTYFETLGLATPCAATEWHPCFVCQAYVCPGAYHCEDCSTCILRRDHHCIFSRSCIGEKNHVNFFGFTFHLTLGTIASTVTAIMVDHKRLGFSSFSKLFMKSIFWYLGALSGAENVFFYALLQLVLTGIVVSSLYFAFYLIMSSKGQTSWAWKRGRILNLSSPKGSYAKFKEFLGPDAILRILFPLCFKTPTGTQHDLKDFISKFNEMKKNSKVKVRISLNG